MFQTVLINREPTAEQMAAYNKLVYVGCDAAQSGTFQGEIILETENKGDINGDGKVSYIMIQGDPENIDAQLRTEYSAKALRRMQAWKWKNSTCSVVTGTATKVRKSHRTTLQNSAIRSKLYSATTMTWQSALCRLSRLLDAPLTKDIYLVGVDALDAALNRSCKRQPDRYRSQRCTEPGKPGSSKHGRPVGGKTFAEGGTVHLC